MCRTSLLNPPVKFTFDEPYSNQPDYKPKEHKESGVYETVFVLEDSPNKIVLQHILQAGGHVVKHWRQDWTYQPQAMWSYAGDYAWQSVALTPAQSQGKWLQTVWQVDDSPRYAGLGEWKNNANYWKSVVKAWDKAFAQNKVLALPYTNQDDADKSAHYLKFFEQAKSVEGKKLTEKQLDQKAETLLNQVLTQGKVQ